MKKLLVLATLVMSVAASGQTLEGSAEGYKGEIGVIVTMDGDKIAKVELKENKETKAMFRKAIPLTQELVGKTSVEGIDTKAGATYSSEGILNAVKDALSKRK